MDTVSVSIIEDEPLVLKSMCGLISARPELELAGVANSVEGFLNQSHKVEPDIILLDIGLPGGMSGLAGIRTLKSRFKKAEIIMLTTFDDSERIFKALCAGASAYLTKRTPFVKIVETILIVKSGGSYMSPAIARKVFDSFVPQTKSTQKLTTRQHEIVDALVKGMSYKMIADELKISIETVRDHIKNIYRKLEINSRAELISRQLNGDIK